MDQKPVSQNPAAPPTQDLHHPLDARRLASILSLGKDDPALVGGLIPDLSDPLQADFGQYTLLELIGQGGMGLVYRARQHSLDREVAIKLLSPTIQASSGSRTRLQSEARHAAALNHPNILPVLEIGTHADIDFIAMPLARGESLADRCRSGALPATSVVALMIPICEAIDYAHRLGLLHLDLKPANILLDEHGAPLVADFGLARRMDAAGQVQAQEVSGTPGFMAPEQVLIKEFRLSRATDVYALGAILFRLLSGRAPHGQGDAREVLQRVLAGKLEPLPADARVPSDLQAICAKAMAWQPEQRYASVADLLQDLRRYEQGLEISVRRLSLRERISRWFQREPQFAWTTTALLANAFVASVVLTVLWQQSERHRLNSEHSAAVLIGAEYSRITTPLLTYVADEVVPIAPCQATASCPSSSLLDLADSPTAATAEPLAAVLATLDRFATNNAHPDAKQNPHRTISTVIRQHRANQLGIPHVALMAADQGFAGKMAATVAHAPGGYRSISERDDPLLVIAGASSPPAHHDPVARTLFNAALALREEEWQFAAAAGFCNADNEVCRAAQDDFRNRYPDNALAHLLTLPSETQAWWGREPIAEVWDRAVLKAAAASRYESVFAESLPEVVALSARVRAALPASDSMEQGYLARQVWQSISADALPRLAGFCRLSAATRDRSDLESACAAIFRKALAQDPRFLRDQRVARCLLLHHLANGAERDLIRAEFRRLSWMQNGLRYLLLDPNENRQWLALVPTHGARAFVESRLQAAGIPIEPPPGFVALEPLPWRDSQGQLMRPLDSNGQSACLID